MCPKGSMHLEEDFSRIVIDVPRGQHRRFKALAAARGESMKIIINEFISEWLDEMEKTDTCKLPHTPNAKTLKALDNAQRGKNLTRAENVEGLLRDLDS